jgi:phosphotriesterase-related protein
MTQTTINTVCGPISSDELGKTLMHEHVLVGFPGWEGDLSMASFDKGEIVVAAVEIFNQLKEIGIKTYVDATPNDLGRFPEMYKEISEKTGVNIICSTGYYHEEKGGGAYWKFRSALADIGQELYDLFMKELTVGIRETGIKAGVIKVASSAGEITDFETAVFKAAAKAQKDTGVPVITHTQEGTMGPEQAKLLIESGADPGQVQIGHMCDNLDIDYQLRTFEQGVYVAWDRMGIQVIEGCPMDEQRYPVLVDLIKHGHADRLMLSHDAVLNILGRPLELPEEFQSFLENANPFHLFKNVIPVLKEQGVTEDQIKTIFEDNPKRLFEGSS